MSRKEENEILTKFILEKIQERIKEDEFFVLKLLENKKISSYFGKRILNFAKKLRDQIEQQEGGEVTVL